MKSNSRKENIIKKKIISKFFSCLDSLSTGLSLLIVSISTFAPAQVDKATDKKKRGGKVREWIPSSGTTNKIVDLAAASFAHGCFPFWGPSSLVDLMASFIFVTVFL